MSVAWLLDENHKLLVLFFLIHSTAVVSMADLPHDKIQTMALCFSHLFVRFLVMFGVSRHANHSFWKSTNVRQSFVILRSILAASEDA